MFSGKQARSADVVFFKGIDKWASLRQEVKGNFSWQLVRKCVFSCCCVFPADFFCKAFFLFPAVPLDAVSSLLHSCPLFDRSLVVSLLSLELPLPSAVISCFLGFLSWVHTPCVFVWCMSSLATNSPCLWLSHPWCCRLLIRRFQCVEGMIYSHIH